MVSQRPKQQYVAHFHEWNASAGVILLRKWNIRCSTVFTTHATLLGRYLSAGRINFYNKLGSLDYDKEAGDRGIYQRVWIERGAAHGMKKKRRETEKKENNVFFFQWF